jgi:sphingosine kinase
MLHRPFTSSSRFVYGYLRGLVRHKACPVKVSIKVAQSDKTQMVKDLHAGEEAAARRMKAARLSNDQSAAVNAESSIRTTHDLSSSSLPPLKYQSEQAGDGWIVFDKEVLYLYGGKGPLVARDLMQFPMSLPDDGYVDVVIQERVSFAFLVGMIHRLSLWVAQPQGNAPGYGWC